MKSGKSHREEYDDEEEEFGANKEATPSANNAKDGKKGEKSSATRSKHSVTEQRRRSKINERFQILRELIPNSDQKRDTASFLFEVIHYVQFLQEKVTRYEGSYQPWSSEPTKMTPWVVDEIDNETQFQTISQHSSQRNNNWRNVAGHPETRKNGSEPAFPIRFDESSAAVPITTTQGLHNPIEPDHTREASCRPIDLQAELPNMTMDIQDPTFSHALRVPPPLDSQPTECPNAMNLQDELTVEGGTINIDSVYSQGLLNSLTQALESTGVDLSQANISVQINLGKRAQSGTLPMDHGNQLSGTFQDASNSEELDQSLKRRKL